MDCYPNVRAAVKNYVRESSNFLDFFPHAYLNWMIDEELKSLYQLPDEEFLSYSKVGKYYRQELKSWRGEVKSVFHLMNFSPYKKRK